MERVFYNLLLNGCQAAQVCGGHVGVPWPTQRRPGYPFSDDGPGVESSIRDKLFQPFVSYGKENGTGLGLTIAQKIVQDHHGSLELESSMPGRTVMRIVLPRVPQKAPVADGRSAGASQPFPGERMFYPPLRGPSEAGTQRCDMKRSRCPQFLCPALIAWLVIMSGLRGAAQTQPPASAESNSNKRRSGELQSQVRELKEMVLQLQQQTVASRTEITRLREELEDPTQCR